MKTNVHLSYAEAVDLFRLLWKQLQEHGDRGLWHLEFCRDGKIGVWADVFGLSNKDKITIKTPSEALREYIKHEEAEGRSPDWVLAEEWLDKHFNLPLEGPLER